MKVLFLTNLPSPYRVNFFSELGKYVDLTVLYERTKASNRNEKWKAEKKNNFKTIFLKSFNIGNENSFSLQAIKEIKYGEFDKIIVGQYSTFTAMATILYMKIKKIPFILNSDGGFIKKDSFVKTIIKKFFISSANEWLSTGKHTTKYLCHYGAKKEKCYIYPFSSVEKKDILTKPLSQVQKNRLKKDVGITEEFAIISVGNYIYRKGFDILLKSGEHLEKNIGIYIVGGKPTQEYISLKEELGLNNVHFIDFLPKKDLMEYYKACDLFVFPTREDIWGLVVNEAMACGLPVVTTNMCIAGLELIKNNYNGTIIEDYENPIELAKNISFIMSNRKKLDFMSKNSLESIKEYTIENMAKKTYEILKEGE